LLEGATVHR